MATISNILSLIDLATGESSYGGFANWGEAADENFRILEKALGDTTAKALTGLDVTLTTDEARSVLVKLSGALVANVNVEVPDKKGFWFISNACTGDYTVTFKTESGAGFVVPNGGTAIAVSDGTDVLRIADATARGNAPRVGYVTKSADYEAESGDDGYFFECTSTLTLSFDAAASLGDGWSCLVKAGPGVTLTLDPDGAEQINGATTLALGEGYAAIIICTGTAFRAIIIGTGNVTLAGTETLSGKTFTSPTINGGSADQPTLILKQSATPAPTAEGEVQWDTDNDLIIVGDGTGQKVFAANPDSTVQGDIEYYTAANVKARLAKGTAAQVLAMNAGATAPEWTTPATVSSSYGAIGTYVFAHISGQITEGSTYAGSSMQPASVMKYTTGGLTDDTIDTNAGVVKGGSALSGTWRAMGRQQGNNRPTLNLFLRIS